MPFFSKKFKPSLKTSENIRLSLLALETIMSPSLFVDASSIPEEFTPSDGARKTEDKNAAAAAAAAAADDDDAKHENTESRDRDDDDDDDDEEFSTPPKTTTREAVVCVHTVI